MPRNKPEPKPLFAVKGDFVDSLDRFCEKAIVLHQAVDTAFQLGIIPDNAASKVLKGATHPSGKEST